MVLLTKYEKLLESARVQNVDVLEHYPFTSTNLKGLYCDSCVALSSHISTEAEKTSILAEELGHHNTSYGIIIDQNDPGNRKQERLARVWAYRNVLQLEDFINAFKYGCRNRYEIAEYLDVTESFLDEAIASFQEQYGLYKSVGNYVIYFDPLGIFTIY